MARVDKRKKPAAKKMATKRVSARKSRTSAKSASPRRSRPAPLPQSVPEAEISKDAEFALPEDCTSPFAEGLRKDLVALRGRDVRIDASRVRRMGGLVLQVVFSASKTWISDGKRLEIAAASTVLLDAARTLGLSNQEFLAMTGTND